MKIAAKLEVPEPQGNASPDPLAFQFDELRALLPGVDHDKLREVLNELIASPVIAGDPLDRESFYFANNLLPAWWAMQKGEHP